MFVFVIELLTVSDDCIYLLYCTFQPF